MKKVFSVFLLIAMVLSVCACSGNTGPGETTSTAATLDELGGYDLYAGFSRENITPEEPVPLGGYGRAESRILKNVLDDLYVTCLALTDANGDTVLLLNWDGVRSYTQTQQLARESISTVTGIDVNRIMIGATHSHSCPEMTNTMDSAQRYSDLVVEQATAAAVSALADRKPANMSAGSIEAEGLNFVRHYETTQADGSVVYFGDNFGTSIYNDTTTHITKADPTMYMLYFTREGGDDIAFINWRAHPHFTGGRTAYDLSADWIGPFRDAFEAQTGVNFIYFNGAAGNINEKSRVSSENKTTDYNAYGALLADYAIECMNSCLNTVEVDEIQAEQNMFEGKVNHDLDPLYYKAKEMQAVWNSTGDYDLVCEMGADSGIRSPYHANSIVSRYSMPETSERELNVILLGDSVSMVTAPNELFDTNAVWLEENSPTEFTLTLGYTNGHFGYVPSAYAWEYTCYETDTSILEPGTAELYQECFLSMINELKAG